ncbi:MAG: adenylate/guanylate cyclase domain-containing protein [Bacteroidota bacterium]
MSKYWKRIKKHWEAYCADAEVARPFFAAFIVGSLYIKREHRDWMIQQLELRIPLLEGQGTLEEAYIKGAYYSVMFGEMDYKEHLRQYAPIEGIFKRFEQQEELTLFHIVYGISHYIMGNKDLASRYFLQAEPQLDPHSIYASYHIICLHYLIEIYLDLKDYEHAENYIIKTYVFSEKAGDTVGIFRSLIERGRLHIQMKNMNTARSYMQTALIYSEDHDLPARYRSHILHEYGYYYMVLEHYEQARTFLLQSRDIRQAEQFRDDLAATLVCLAELELATGQDEEAMQYLQETEKLCELLKSKPRLKQVYALMASYYERHGDYQTALQNYKRYQSLNEDILGEESERQLKQLRLSLEIENSKRENELLSQKNDEISNQKEIIEAQKEEVERLLLNILPEQTARELQRTGKATAHHLEDITVAFTDFIGFTQIAEQISPDELVAELDELFRHFDDIVARYPLEKIKTIGDAYMFVGGLQGDPRNGAINAIAAALDIQEYLKQRRELIGKDKPVLWQTRLGIHTGPVTAGVVGKHKFAFDIWGTTVILASRMESSGVAGRVNISSSTYELVKTVYDCEYRGKVKAKNKGEVDMYFVQNRVLSIGGVE